MKNHPLRILLKGVCLLGAVFFCLPSNAQTVLTIHHFLSPESVTHKEFILPWAKEIEEKSNGRIVFEIFPSMT
jgi:TRAP-type C4-dicarboxylate transport system substrate-binding protein